MVDDDSRYAKHQGETVNRMLSEDAIRLKERISEIIEKRAYYVPATVYKDMAEFAEAVGNWLEPYEESETPESMQIKEGYNTEISDNVRIKAEHGAKIINPLLGICDSGDFTFVVANDIIPNSFDVEEISSFLDILDAENEDMYENSSSCRSACTGICVGTCGNTCDGCYEACDNVCTGCGVCTGECSHLCGGSCEHECTGQCTKSCGAGCLSGCTGTCTNGCFLVCYAACGGGCTYACSHTCKGGVGQ